MENIQENYYDLFEKGNETEINSKSSFDTEKWKEKKQKERESVYGLLEEATLDAASQKESFLNFLNIQAQFDNFSVGNALLISKQYKEAERLNDFNTWKELGSSVKKGENGVTIEYDTGINYSSKDSGTKNEYVLNTYRKKFHKPDCESVASMNSQSRKDVVDTRENILKQGYSPCGTCKP